MPKIMQVFLIPKLCFSSPTPTLMSVEETGQQVGGVWVCTGQGRIRGTFSLYHDIAEVKQGRRDFICLLFLPKCQGLRSYSPPQYSINFLGHDIAGQEIKLIHVTLSKPLSMRLGMRPREGKEFSQSHTAKRWPASRQKVLPGRSKLRVQDSPSPGSCAEESLAWHPPGPLMAHV